MNKKINSANQIKIGAVLGYVNYAVKMIVQLLYVPIMLRLLGQSEYGVYQLVASLISYLSLLNFGFSGAYLRFFSQCKHNRNKEAVLNGTFLIVFFIFAILALIVGGYITINSGIILGSKLTNNELVLAQKLLAILTFNMVLTFPLSVFTSIITSREEFIFLKLLELAKSILNPFLVVTLLILGYGSIALVVITTILTIMGGAISIWFAVVKIQAPFSFKHFDHSLVKNVGTFSFFLFLNSIIDQINWNLDKYILGRMVGTAAIAIYSVGAQINNIYIQITDMLATVLAPRVNELVALEKNPLPKLNTLFIMIGRLQAYIIMAVISGFLIYGKEFIVLWAGKEYTQAYYVTLFLIIPVSIPLCQTLGVDIQRALNKHQYRSIVYACIAISNVIISIPLAQLFGAVGTAMGTGISLIVGNGIAMNIIYKKVIGLDIWKFWKEIIKILPAVIIPSISGYLLKQFLPVDSLYKFIFEGIVFAIIYLVCIYLISMNQEEKNFVNTFITQIFRYKH